MGVDYSYGMGYGVAGTYDDESELPGKLKGLDWEELQTLDLPEGLTLSVGGNMMCGPSRWALLVARTQIRMSKYDESAPVTKLEGITMEEATLLTETLHELQIEPDFIGWHFLADIS